MIVGAGLAGAKAAETLREEGYEGSLVLVGDESERLRAVLGAGARLVVVGAGWIGSEAAASARQLGMEVTVLERLAVPLETVLGPTGARSTARPCSSESAWCRARRSPRRRGSRWKTGYW